MDPNLTPQTTPAPVNKKLVIAALGGLFLIFIIIAIILFPRTSKETSQVPQPSPEAKNPQNSFPNINKPSVPTVPPQDKKIFSEKNYPFAKQIFPDGILASSSSTTYQGYVLTRSTDPSGGIKVKFTPSVAGYQPFEVVVKPGYKLYFSVESPSDPSAPAKSIDLGENFAITVDPEGHVSE